MAALKRIKEEMNSHGEELSSHGITAGPINGDNLFKWTASIQGPPGTPYAGGTFHLKITFSESYPHQPPEVKFITKIFHPHICTKRGKICADLFDVSKVVLRILINSDKFFEQKEWSKKYNILSILLSIISFLSDLRLMEWYNERTEILAKQWTLKYAIKSKTKISLDRDDQIIYKKWVSSQLLQIFWQFYK